MADTGGRRRPEELLDFPCDFTFKAFGPALPPGVFLERVRAAVDGVVPIGPDRIKVRNSRAGSYISVSVTARLETPRQLEQCYRQLQKIPGLRYLL